MEHFTEIYTLTNEKKKDSNDNLAQKHLLYMQFVAWSCDECSVAPLTDYIHNPVYQELTEEEKYFTNKSDECIYLDLRASVWYTDKMEKLERNNLNITLYITPKSAATTKLRFQI